MPKTVLCPDCGAQLLVEDASRKFAVCPYCDAQVRININVNYNYNYSKSEHTEHIVDEAKSKSADNVNRVIGIFATPFEEYRAKKEHKRHMEEEAQRAAEEQTREWQRQVREDAQRRAEWRAENFPKIAHYVADHKQETLLAVIVCILLLFSVIGFAQRSSDRAARLAADSLAARVAAGEVQMPASSFSGDYRTAVRDLKNAGFTNVTAEGAGDLYLGFLNKENDIIEVTVDGAPDFTQGDWFRNDVPIVISYHSFRIASSSSVEQTDAATISHAADICYEATSEDYTECYKISPSSGIVYYYLKNNGSIPISIVGHITSGSMESGYIVHFDYGDGWDETITITDSGVTVIRSDGTDGTYTTPLSSEEVQKAYQENAIAVPEGIALGDLFASAESETSESISSNSTGSISEDAFDRAVTYEMAYTLDHGSYSTCYYIDFPNDKVYYFSYGNGDETAMVGHILSGTYAEGITVHYKYSPGWDETMSFSDGSMTITDAYGTSYTYSKVDAAEAERILAERTLISEY